MKLFLLILLAAAVVFVVWVIGSLIRDNRSVTRTIRQEGFTGARIYRPQNIPACAAFDDTTRRALFISENQVRIIPYDRLTWAQTIVNSDQVTHRSERHVLGNAIIGNTIAGQKGAIVGALMAMDEKPRQWTEDRYNRIGVEISFFPDEESHNTETFTVFFLGDSRAGAGMKNNDSVSRDIIREYRNCAYNIAEEVRTISKKRK